MQEKPTPHEMFGICFKQHRMSSEMTLREFCNKCGLDPSNISKIERGKMSAPRGETLRRYARFLSLEEEGDSWFEFMDLAAAAAGIIPDDIMSDTELVKKMPVLFRSMRKDKLEELMKRIKET